MRDIYCRSLHSYEYVTDPIMPFVSTYDIDTVTVICTEIATSNKSLATICDELALALSTVLRWRADIPEFAEMYRAAQEDRADFLAEEMLRIADTPAADLVEAQDRKLQVDVRKFIAAKLKPKTYGDNKSLAVDVKVRQTVSDTQYQRLLEAAASAEVFEDAEIVEDDDDLG